MDLSYDLKMALALLRKRSPVCERSVRITAEIHPQDFQEAMSEVIFLYEDLLAKTEKGEGK